MKLNWRDLAEYDHQQFGSLNKLLLNFFLVSDGKIDTQVPEPKNCETIGTGCFIIEASMKLDWNSAKAKCESVGAKLAHPNKVQMEGLLEHLQPKGGKQFIILVQIYRGKSSFIEYIQNHRFF